MNLGIQIQPRVGININKRRIFTFKSGLHVEVFYHHGRKTWAAEAWEETHPNSEISGLHHIATTLDLDEHIGKRRESARYLRKAIAEKKNPRIRAVNNKICPSGNLNYAEIEMRYMAHMSGATRKNADSLILGSTIV